MTGVAGSGASRGWAGSWGATKIRLVFLGIREERWSNGDWNLPLTDSPSLTPLPFQPGRACGCQHHRMGTGGLRVRQFLPRSVAWTDPPVGRTEIWVRLHPDQSMAPPQIPAQPQSYRPSSRGPRHGSHSTLALSETQRPRSSDIGWLPPLPSCWHPSG